MDQALFSTETIVGNFYRYKSLSRLQQAKQALFLVNTQQVLFDIIRRNSTAKGLVYNLWVNENSHLISGNAFNRVHYQDTEAYLEPNRTYDGIFWQK